MIIFYLNEQHSFGQPAGIPSNATNSNYPKQPRYSPYYGRFYNQTQHYQNNITSCFAQQSSLNSTLNSSFGDFGKCNSYSHNSSIIGNSNINTSNNYAAFPLAPANNSNENKDTITLQISNLDASIEEHHLRNYLMSQLKPITPVISLTIESPSLAKVKVPSQQVELISNILSIRFGYTNTIHNMLVFLIHSLLNW